MSSSVPKALQSEGSKAAENSTRIFSNLIAIMFSSQRNGPFSYDGNVNPALQSLQR